MPNAAIRHHSATDSAEVHRNAYNAAFYELGLKWHWDVDTYRSLLPNATETDRIKFYVANHQPHLLNAYDAEFLVNAIQAAKARCYENMTTCGAMNDDRINWAEIHAHEVGV